MTATRLWWKCSEKPSICGRIEIRWGKLVPDHRGPLALSRLTVIVFCFFSTSCLAQTALDQYVAFDDGAFAFEEYDTDPGLGWTTHLLKLTSQRWRGADDVDCGRRLQNSWLDACDLWQHELTLYVPDTIRLGSIGGVDSSAVLVIGGGSNRGELMRSGNEYGGAQFEWQKTDFKSREK